MRERRLFEGDPTLCERVEAYALEAEKLVDIGDVFLIAGDPVERLGAQHVEPPGPCIIKQPEHPGPAVDAGAGDGLIIVNLGDLPAFARRELPANAELIVDGFRALEVGGVSGVEGGFGHRRSGILEPRASGSKRMAMEGVQAGSAGSHPLRGSPLRPSPGRCSIPYYASQLVAGCATPDLNLRVQVLDFVDALSEPDMTKPPHMARAGVGSRSYSMVAGTRNYRYRHSLEVAV